MATDSVDHDRLDGQSVVDRLAFYGDPGSELTVLLPQYQPRAPRYEEPMLPRWIGVCMMTGLWMMVTSFALFVFYFFARTYLGW